MEPVWALGFMSGTSLDGIDAAFILSEGHRILDEGITCFLPYTPEFRQEIKKCFGQKEKNLFVSQVEKKLTKLHAQLAKRIIKKSPVKPQLIGFPGQTIFHAPPKTFQIGDGELLAKMTGIPVVYDFRTHDCSKGGQGAPLVPVYHQALYHRTLGKVPVEPSGIVNIGGVSNITYMEGQKTLIAFDTGPGNALIDDFMEKVYNLPFDEEGKIAASGIANQQMVDAWLQDPFFTRPYPKSLDRDSFSRVQKALKSMIPADGVATLTLFTAAAIVLACTQLPQRPEKLILCGGGAQNQTLKKFLMEKLKNMNILTAESLGWQSDFLEAQAFSFLAIRNFYGLPVSFPLTTGVKFPLTGGKMTQTYLNQGGKFG